VSPASTSRRESPLPDELLFFHGTDVQSADELANEAPLDATIARNRHIDGHLGFYLATEASDAEFFAARRGAKGWLTYRLNQDTLDRLLAVGARLQSIPGRPPPWFQGNELFVPTEAFSEFNRMLTEGAIRVEA